jgi:hypothetical protein
MAISKNMIAFGIAGLGLVVLFGYLAHASVDVQTFPDVEVAARAGFGAPLAMAPHEYVPQSNTNVPLVNTPHRYPNTTGDNISALIHHGMDPLRMRAPRDSRWIECPPAEVMY